MALNEEEENVLDFNLETFESKDAAEFVKTVVEIIVQQETKPSKVGRPNIYIHWQGCMT